jgi:hypothetical protein
MPDTDVRDAYREEVCLSLRRHYRGSGLRVYKRQLNRHQDSASYDPDSDPDSEGVDLLVSLKWNPPVAPNPAEPMRFFCGLLFTNARVIVKLFTQTSANKAPGPTTFRWNVGYERWGTLRTVLQHHFGLALP